MRTEATLYTDSRTGKWWASIVVTGQRASSATHLKQFTIDARFFNRWTSGSSHCYCCSSILCCIVCGRRTINVIIGALSNVVVYQTYGGPSILRQIIVALQKRDAEPQAVLLCLGSSYKNNEINSGRIRCDRGLLVS